MVKFVRIKPYLLMIRNECNFTSCSPRVVLVYRYRPKITFGLNHEASFSSIIFFMDSARLHTAYLVAICKTSDARREVSSSGGGSKEYKYKTKYSTLSVLHSLMLIVVTDFPRLLFKSAPISIASSTALCSVLIQLK